MDTNFSKAQREIQIALLKIWTWIANSISWNNNRYTALLGNIIMDDNNIQ